MRRNGSTKTAELRQRNGAALTTPIDLTRSATKDIASAMNAILGKQPEFMTQRRCK